MGSSHDEVFRDLLRKTDEFGWAVRHVGAGSEPGEAAFSYTVGLTAFDHPEVVITGMPFDSAQVFLTTSVRTFVTGSGSSQAPRPRS